MKTIADHILDIIQNSVRASASRIRVEIRESNSDDTFTVKISDNGTGMDQVTAEKARDPFFTSRTSRRVGLGLPLLQQNAEQCGGSLLLSTMEGVGTTVAATFRLSHIDRPPTGDVAGVFLLSAIGKPHIELSYTHITGNGCFSLSTTEVKEALGDLPMGADGVMQGVRELITHNLESIQASK